MPEGPTLRRATPADAAFMLRHIHFASDGLARVAWRHYAPAGVDLDDYGMTRALRSEGSFCWPNTTIAEWNGQPAGMLVAYRLRGPEPLDDLPAVFRPLVALENLCAGWTYVAAVSVEPALRGRGIASTLLASVQDQPTCLIRGDTNPAAALYLRHGYGDVAREAAVSDDLWTSPYASWVLMQRPAGVAPAPETR